MHGLISILCLLVTPALAEFSQTTTLDHRAEYVQAEAPQALRYFLKGQELAQYGEFKLSMEGFADYDGAAGFPDQRRDRHTAVLQEAFLEYKHESVFFRIGRQPVRWSESWTLPSLDVWTARRWNRLFFDPVPEQLIHPTGVFGALVLPEIELDVFQNLLPGVDRFPKPFPETHENWHGETGVRAKTRLQGFDLAGIFASQQAGNVYGANLSYAFDSFVPKLEAGTRPNDNERFLAAEVDVFIEQFSILPNFTVFTATDLTADQEQTLFYLPIRYTKDRHSFEAQGYLNPKHQDKFYSFLYAYDLLHGFQATAYVQNYFGNVGTLFGTYQQMTHGLVMGLRLELTHGLF